MNLRPRPRWGAYSAPPDPLAGFKWPTSKGRGEKEEGEEKGWERREGEGKGKEGRGKGSCLLLNGGLVTPLHSATGSPHPCANTCGLSHFVSKSVDSFSPTSQDNIHVYPTGPAEPTGNKFCQGAYFADVINCTIFPIRFGVWFCKRSKFGFSYRSKVLPLT